MMVAVVTWHFAQPTPGGLGKVWEFQYEMVPSRVANAKLTLRGVIPYAAVPVGLPVPAALAGGIVTVRSTMFPLASYNVDRPVTSSDTHHLPLFPTLLVKERDRPQGFTRCGSVVFVTIF